MSQNKMKLLMCSDDPFTILSYGLLSDMIIDKIYRDYDIHYLSLQRQVGKAIPIRNKSGDVKYTYYASHNDGPRNPTNLPFVINKVKPDIFWTNFDIQHYQTIKQYIPPGATWVGWIPWDNHDPNQIPRAQEAFNKVDTRIAISKFGMEFMRQHGIAIDDYIYNCINTDKFEPLADDHPDILKFKEMNKNWYNEDLQLLLFVGRPNWRKRMRYMFAILRMLIDRGNNNVRLFMHTSLDDPAAEGNLREIIDAFGLANYVITTNFHWDSGVPEEDLRILYNVSDLYIAPHGGEGFGMPIVEAMACGLPFVASDICTTREFAGPNNERGLPSEVVWPKLPDGSPVFDKGVYRSYPDVLKFAEKIEQLLADDKRRKRMGENGAKWVKENCSIQVVADKWRKVLNKFDIPIFGVNEYK